MIVSVWYLLIFYAGKHVVAVPQASREQCLQNAKFIQEDYRSTRCVPGVIAAPIAPKFQ